jgi:hypothetical protein
VTDSAYATASATATFTSKKEVGPISGTAARSSGFIVSPFYDLFFFIGSPLLALGLGILIWASRLSATRIVIFGHEGSATGIFLGTFVFSHLLLAFFRSHGNTRIYRAYPLRFSVVPIAVFIAMCFSEWLVVALAVVGTWWDVYHSSLQTFGFARIYDSRRGNDERVGRWLDIFLSLLLYAGPILAGVCLPLHTRDFRDFEEVGSTSLAHIGDYIDARSYYLRAAIFVIGIPFLLYYIFAYYRYYKQGYKVSVQKVVLLAVTGFCSIFTWGFNTFGEAFFIMNFFHALQYFAIVWWSEKKNLNSLLRFDRVRKGTALTLVLFLAVSLGFGCWAELVDSESLGTSTDFAFNAIILVALMHFWYDGFFWSVRKQQV